jgi:hypothetical protein
MFRKSAIATMVLILAAAAAAKDPPAQVISWPANGAPVVRFNFGRFRDLAAQSGRHNYSSDVVAENLWGKPIPRAEFNVYLFDKNKTRIGEGYIQLSNVGIGQTVKFEFSTSTIGQPVSLELVPRSLPRDLQSYLQPRKVTVTVNSIPQGAALRLDGKEVGLTPKLVEVSGGKHLLEFSKQGYNVGHFPLEISSDDVSGGSISYELGSATHDTVELRDGSVLNGDVERVTATTVEVRIGGQVQVIERNKVKRIILIEREPPPQS